MIACLGALENLCGISHECDFPEQVATLPVLTRSRIDPQGTSRAIDVAVRGVIENALSIYAVDEALLGSLAPDVIVTQDLCEVCAVSIDDVRSAVARLLARGDRSAGGARDRPLDRSPDRSLDRSPDRSLDRVKVVSLRPTLLAHVFEDVERVAEALELGDAGRRVRAELEARLREVAAQAGACAAVKKSRPRVVSIEWIDPLMLGGLWMPELIALAGGVAAGVESGAPAPTISAEDLRALDPDVVLVKPCGFSLPRTMKERELIETTIARAAPRARVYVADGNAYFNRPGPRLVESAELLAACVHPELEGWAVKHAASVLRLR